MAIFRGVLIQATILSIWPHGGATQDVTHFSSPLADEEYRPFIDLPTQVTDFEPTRPIAGEDAFPTSTQVATSRPQFLGNLVSAANSFLAGLGRKGAAHQRIRKKSPNATR